MNGIQVIRHKCCGKIFAACHEPECYIDEDWLNSLKQYVLRGDTVEVVNYGEVVFGVCECKKDIKSEPDLFNSMGEKV